MLTSVVKWSEGLSKRVSIIFRRCIEHTKFAVLWLFHSSHSFILFCSIVYRCVYGCVFCMFLFNFVNYVFLLLCLCTLIVTYVAFWVLCFLLLFCVLFVCKCVLYY